MRRRVSAFEIYLRVGRRPADDATAVETKFNPWHDPEDGRFTFARQGRFFGRGGSSGTVGPNRNAVRVRSLSKTKVPRTPAPKTTDRASSAAASRALESVQNSATFIADPKKALERIRREMGPSQSSLTPIATYSETGSGHWRAANDRVFIEATKGFNRQRGLKPGDPKYVDPLLVKAWAMVESGGSKSAFLRDPLQVNNPGDYKKPKPQITGLAKDQRMTPRTSIEAALKWLEFRGYYRDDAGNPGPWIGFEEALQRYNGRSDLYPAGVPHKIWYARQVMKLYRDAKEAK